jgi:hypothetical protein
MPDKPNPWSKKAKKSKLKAFGSGKRKGGVAKTSPPKRATPPVKRAVVKKENPFQQKRRRRQELERIEGQIAQLMVDYEAAFEVEGKLSQRWQKLKPGTAIYTTTEKKWSLAMREVERIQTRLLGMTAVRRKLKEKM